MLFGLLVFVVGIVLSIPYCFLAGWSGESWRAVAVLSSFFLFQWLILAHHARILAPDPEHFIDWKEIFTFKSRVPLTWASSKIAFWAWTVMCIFPILVHLASLLIGVMGNQEVSGLLWKYRYIPIPIFLVLIVLGWILWRRYFYPKELADIRRCLPEKF